MKKNGVWLFTMLGFPFLHKHAVYEILELAREKIPFPIREPGLTVLERWPDSTGQLYTSPAERT